MAHADRYEALSGCNSYDYEAGYRTDHGEDFVAVLFLAGFGFLLLKMLSGKSTFDGRDMEAFRKAEQIRKDLSEVQDIVKPGPKNAYSATFGLTVPTPPAADDSKK